MKKTLFLTLFLSVFVFTAGFAQSIVGKWKMSTTMDGAQVTATYTFDEDGYAETETKTVEKVTASGCTISYITQMISPGEWKKNGNTIRMSMDMDETEINVSSKFLSGTPAQKREYQQGAAQLHAQGEQEMLDDLAEGIIVNDYKILSLTANSLKIQHGNDRPIALQKVAAK